MIGKKIKVCKDRENATLMLYSNICNIWHKNVIQISYKNKKFLVCFLLAAGQYKSYAIIQLQVYQSSIHSVVVIQKHIDTCYFNIFRVQIIHSYYALKYNCLLQ